MEKIYSFLTENAEERQFSLEELMDRIEGEGPQLRIVRNRLFARYGDDILTTRMFVLKTQVTKFSPVHGMTVEVQIIKQKDNALRKQLLKSYERI